MRCWFKGLLIGVVTALTGIAWAQIPGPVSLQGQGGNSINSITSPVIGTGGTISTQGAYTVHVFNSSGTFTVPAGLTSVDVLIVGGGGGGGSTYGGGGGAGGLRWLTGQAVTPGAGISVVVGTGGTGGNGITVTEDTSGNGSNGGNSSFGGLIALGGGYGQGGAQNTAGTNGGSGGSGGGGGGITGGNQNPGGTGSAGQGNNGGAGGASTTDSNRTGGGGGGAGAVGSAGTNGAGGNGGVGQNFSAIFGTGVGASGWFAGGGGGGKRSGGGSAGTGGQGGGGAGGSPASPAATAGAANTGGGGGGSGGSGGTVGAAGGSGIVIVRYIAPTQNYIVHTFTSGGNFTPPPGVTAVELLAVGGGGGGGSSTAFGTAGSGGGGAGGLIYRSSFAVGGTVAVGIGGGGAAGGAGNNSGINGGNTTFGSLTALGGGGGIGGNGNGNAGGSGGGSRGGTGGAGNQPGSASGGFGFAGGNSGGSPGGAAGAGGGGAGATGQNLAGTSGEAGGNGGIGRTYSLTGTSVYYAGGGGGGGSGTFGIGTGGLGGGGNGGNNSTVPTAGQANRGGGGGGGNNNQVGAAGGSGVVIVRYVAPTMTIFQQPSATGVSGVPLSQPPIIRILNSAGNPVSGVNVTAALQSGTGTLGGTVTVATNASGQAVFDNLFITGAVGNRTIRFTAAGASQIVVSQTVELVTYYYEISHASTMGVCVSGAPITISVFDSADNPLTNFNGTVTITNSGNRGNYANGDGQGSLVNLPANDGAAQYTFSPDDNGDVVLNFSTSTTGALTFDANTGSNGTENYALSLNVQPCSFRLIHDEEGDVCRPEQITIQVVDPGGAVVPSFVGPVNLSTAGVTGGTWSKTGTASDAFGTLVQGTPNSGAATYSFTVADAGEVVLRFKDNIAETVNFNVTASGVSQPVAPYDDDLVFTACVFRVQHVTNNNTDVCSIKEIDITLVDSDGVAVDDYTGTINLSTNTGFGTWVDGGLGTLNDPVPEDGNATYTFVDADDGSVRLEFRHSSDDGAVNINVSDGVTLDPRNFSNPYDQNLLVANCTFEIEHAGTMSACSVTDVDITVRNSTGGIAVDYLGTVNISTSTNHGNWLLEPGDGEGTLIDVADDDNGVATYEFDEDDDGVVRLTFIDLNPENVSIDLIDGVIVEDGAEDPDLMVTSCFPEVFAGPACTNPGNSTTIAIPARESLPAHRGRMVLMMTMQEGTTNVSNATFAGANMTLIRREKNTTSPGSTIELWGILDAAMPAGAGTFSGTFTGATAGTSMCLLSVTEVNQDGFPVQATPAATGPLNSSQVTGNASDAQTLITTTANNSFVVSFTSNDFGNFNESFYYFEPPQPATVLTRIFGGRTGTGGPGQTLANPSNGRSTGSAGVQGATGVIEALEPFYSAFEGFGLYPAINTHIVAAFEPLITGDPLAVGYVPVTLFQTFSGNMSYRAIGNSLRSTPSLTNNTVDPAADCSFVDFAVGAEATLALPAGSTAVAAYLYWMGSGSEADVDEVVDFGQTGSEITITADEVFLIEGVTDSPVDFFAAYKDVSALVSGNGDYTLKNLVVQDGSPAVTDWDNNGTCAGGWSMIVVYEHPNERLRVLNLFHGFQPFQNSAFTLVPRNFRMATYDPPYLPNGQVTHITLEGDESLDTGDEALGIQDFPDAATFTPITSSLNPPNSEFNSTVTRPIYELIGDYFEYDSDGGINGDGYAIDFPGPDAVESGRTGKRIGSTWGVDVDTHYIGPTTLEDFSQLGSEAERITTRYSAGQDLVMLISEVISVTNFPLADLEIFKTEASTFKVNSTGTYEILVTNNGNGSVTEGEATGEIIVADVLPAGMTFSGAGSVTGTDWSCSVTLSPGAFTCVYDIAADAPGGELAPGASLPVITATVQIGDASFFPLQSNNAKNSARVLHSGGNCTAAANGLIPDPDSCDRSPQFDNVNDLQGGSIDINDLEDKQLNNNNVDSTTTIVKGVEIDLRMNKSVSDILEVGETAQYTLNVSNAGPDATTSTFTVTDTAPPGVSFQSAAGTGWSCSGLPGPTMTCTHAGSLASGDDTDILLEVTVTGAEGDVVTNTAQVTAGANNFDVAPSNNSDTDVSTIVGPPVASQEKFLLSVSTPGNSTSIGGLNNFQNHDLIIYDPETDEAVMYFDNSFGFDGTAFNVNDANAVHLLKNGHIVMSAASASTVGTNAQAFDPWDLAVYDPILGTAQLYLDGETVFTDHTNVDINAVYILDNGNILLSTVDGGIAGSNNLAFTRSDIIEYNPVTGLASIYLDGSDSHVFDGEDVDIDAYYQRVDPGDPNDVIPSHILSVANESTVIGAGGDPIGGTTTTRDDVVELDLTNGVPNHETANLFLGDEELGVFEPTDAARRLDALHVVEDGYIGHFSIKQVISGDACTPMQIRISKHMGLSHDRDIDYEGSIEITTDTGIGNFSLVDGDGNLSNGTSNDGAAIYTFVDSDDGTVILSLSQDDTPGTVNIDVTNRIAREIGSEDGPFTFNPVFTPITYRDEFTTAAFDNNDGTLFWDSPWVEVDAFNGTAGSGAGVGTGNVRIVGGEARFTSNINTSGGGFFPSLTRTVDLDEVPFTEEVRLSFHFRYTGLAPADSFVVEARESSSQGWTIINTFTGLTGSGSGTRDLSLSGPLDEGLFSNTTQIRFRVANGYAVENYMFIDNVEVSTATTECGYSSEISLDHYAISHAGVGIACLATPITITAHDASHTPVESGETILLSVDSSVPGGKGTWFLTSGAGVLGGAGTLAGGADNGQATYTFAPGETSATFWLNHTVPGTVNINVTGQTTGLTELMPLEDPELIVNEAGLVFYNETLLDYSILTQIAGKPSNVAPYSSLLTVQAIRTSDENPQACAPIFAPGETLTIGLAAECKDPGSCQAGETYQINGENISLVDDNAVAGASGYTDVQLDFITQPSGATGATIVMEYSDVGEMELHARYDIPFENDPDETNLSGDYLFGTSEDTFIVRPFGFDIDFSDGRENNGTGDVSYAADANGSLFEVAGDPFDTTVTAMAWQAVDDADNDGQPDVGADLSDNHPTPNFDQDDAQSDDYSVKLSIVETKVPGGVDGVLTDDDFDIFIAGANTHTMNYNEVGIIDIQADLVDVSDDPVTYLGTDNIIGRAPNVGRFYPKEFTITNAVLNSRADQSCSPASTFTYMDEEFELVLELTATNRQDEITVNYRGDFAKLAAYADLNFAAITDVDMEDDIDRSSRLARVTMPATFQAQWAADTAGVLELTGTLMIIRADPADPDGPFENLQIAFVPTDSDGVTVPLSALNVDVDDFSVAEPGDDVLALIAEHDFYYGRMLLNNAYGSEFEPLAITLRVERWDGDRFVINNLDDCTTIDADELSFVTGTFTGDLVEGSNEPGIVAPDDSEFFDGQIQGLQAATSPTDEPLTINPTADNAVGTVDIELDLSSATGLNLEYLTFEWLGVGDGDAADDDYDEMPRAQIEWGQFRNHDRVINWQEIYNAPTP